MPEQEAPLGLRVTFHLILITHILVSFDSKAAVEGPFSGRGLECFRFLCRSKALGNRSDWVLFSSSSGRVGVRERDFCCRLKFSEYSLRLATL